jgi:hypothetical protein
MEKWPGHQEVDSREGERRLGTPVRVSFIPTPAIHPVLEREKCEGVVQRLMHIPNIKRCVKSLVNVRTTFDVTQNGKSGTASSFLLNDLTKERLLSSGMPVKNNITDMDWNGEQR